MTTKECFIPVEGLFSFFYFIIVLGRKIIKNESNLIFKR